jgi:hypothetical protein
MDENDGWLGRLSNGSTGEESARQGDGSSKLEHWSFPFVGWKSQEPKRGCRAFRLLSSLFYL